MVCGCLDGGGMGGRTIDEEVEGAEWVGLLQSTRPGHEQPFRPNTQVALRPHARHQLLWMAREDWMQAIATPTRARWPVAGYLDRCYQ